MGCLWKSEAQLENLLEELVSWNSAPILRVILLVDQDLLRVIPLNESDTSGSHAVKPLTRAHGAITAIREDRRAVLEKLSDDVSVVHDHDASPIPGGLHEVGIVEHLTARAPAEHLLGLGVVTGKPTGVARPCVLLGRWL